MSTLNERSDIGRLIDQKLENKPKVLTSRLDLYLAINADTASDSNVGTSSAAPLKTLNAALRIINSYAQLNKDAPCVLHIASGTYTWGETLGPIQLQAPIAIVGDGAGQEDDDGFTELVASTAAGAGTGQRVVVSSGMTVNEFQGKTIEILSGGAAGDRRTIRNNTATDIVPCVKFTAAVAPGDAFRIVEPAVVVQYSADQIFGGEYRMMGVGSPVFSVTPSTVKGDVNPSSILLANMRIQSDGVTSLTQWRFASSMLTLAGVETPRDALGGTTGTWNVDPYSQIAAGMDRGGLTPQFMLPVLLGLADVAQRWAGWGWHCSDLTLESVTNIFGCFVYTSSGTNRRLYGTNLVILAGAFTSDPAAPLGTNGWLGFDTGQHSLAGLDSALPILVECAGNSDGTYGLAVGGGGRVFLENVAVTVTGQGIGVLGTSNHGSSVAHAPGLVALRSGVSISAPRVALGASYGGKAYYDDPPTLPVAPSVGEAAVWQGPEAGVPTATSTFAGLADGASIVNATTPGDGSVVMRVT